MFLRKKTKLRIAYGLLTVTALSVIVYDAEVRSDGDLRLQSTQAERVQSRQPAAPLPILPLAQSPFPEARPGSLAIARTDSDPAPSRENRAAHSDTYFLKVAMKVDAGDGPIALARGTRVRLLRYQDGKLRVTRDGTDFLVEKAQVTDDLATLGALARNSS